MPFNKRSLKYREKLEFARRMRRNPTEPEAIIWDKVRNKGLGVKFRRQVLLLGWIVDFYCPSRKLVVEIDGKCHDPHADAIRDRAMKREGLTILRIPARDVYRNSNGVARRISQYI